MNDDCVNKNHRSNLIKVCVIGLGFVGAASCVAISNARNRQSKLIFNVTGVDKNNKDGLHKINLINKGNFPFETKDLKLKKSLKGSINQGNLVAVPDNSIDYSEFDVICVDINLDVSKIKNNKHNIKFNNLKNLFKKIASNIKSKTLILLESTVPPGTCENILWPIILNELKRRDMPPESIFLGHSYERVMPGKNYLDSIHNYWRVYSGINENSKKKCREFLNYFINTKDFPLTELKNIRDSETAKIIENSYRAVNIAFIEEWSSFCFDNNIDLTSILDSIRLRPSHRNIMKPGVGVGGYCLTKDPLMGDISQKQIYKNISSDFIFSKTAVKINQNMPLSTFIKYKKLFKNKKDKNCLIMGYSYKEDIADTRNSASETFAMISKRYFNNVIIYDPMIKNLQSEKFRLLHSLYDLQMPLDSIFLTVAHKEFSLKKTINFLSKLKVRVFDLNNVLTINQIYFLQDNGVSVYAKGRSF